jgi:hypothetical protein
MMHVHSPLFSIGRVALAERKGPVDSFLSPRLRRNDSNTLN